MSTRPTRVPRMDPDIDPRADALALIDWVEVNGTALAPIADWRTVTHNLRAAVEELGGADWRRNQDLEACLRGIGRWVQAGAQERYREGALRRIREVLGE